MGAGALGAALSCAAGALVGCAFEDAPELATTAAALDSNGTLWSVPSAFAAVPTSGVRMGVRPGAFSMTALSNSTNHFQGVARLAQGAYLALTGSKASDLFLIDLASRSDSATGRWGTNRPGGAAPPAGDAAVARLDVGAAAGYPSYDHAGGLQAIGGYVAIGLEPLGATSSSPSSAVALVQVTNPSAPQLVSTIDRGGEGTAGAVGITRLLDGTWLMAVGEYDSAKIDFYQGVGGSLATAGWTLVDRWQRSVSGSFCSGPGQDSNWGAYQNLNLFTQSDGKVYLVGMHRDSGGDDYADLYELSFLPEVLPCSLGSTQSGWDVRATKLANKHVTCTDYCDFDGGAGMYLDSAAQGLVLYGVERLFSSSRSYLRLNEM